MKMLLKHITIRKYVVFELAELNVQSSIVLHVLVLLKMNIVKVREHLDLLDALRIHNA